MNLFKKNVCCNNVFFLSCDTIPLNALPLNAMPLNTVPLNVIPLKAVPLKCVSVNNQKCRIRPKIININSNEPIFYLDGIKVNKCSRSCNNIDDPY